MCLLEKNEEVRFVRRRFGHHEVIDFLAVLFGYAISGERTLEAFYSRFQPFAVPFMALFERDWLPARSTLSRFLAALTEEPIEALRMLFLDDLLSRPLTNEQQVGGLMDRMRGEWVVFDLDGTREAARQRALPKTEDLPPPSRRLDDVCAAGYTGRKCGGSRPDAYGSFSGLIAPNGSAVLAIVATDATERNYARALRRSHATSQHTNFRRNVPCSCSMGNTAPELSFAIWPVSRL